MPSWNGASTVCLNFDFDALSVWLAYDEPTEAIRSPSADLSPHTLALLARTGDVARSIPEAA
jgi:hypothetical protein